MLRFMTAGESHGPALTAILDGFPAGLALDAALINRELLRRQLGYGAGPRMKLEKDTVQIMAGVMDGRTRASGASACTTKLARPSQIVWSAARSRIVTPSFVSTCSLGLPERSIPSPRPTPEL